MTEAQVRWTAVVRAWRSSGKPAHAFAAERGIVESTLKYWARTLERASSARSRAPRAVLDPRPATTTPTLARVVRESDSTGDADAITIDIAGARVAVRRGFDHELLREVVQALAGAMR